MKSPYFQSSWIVTVIGLGLGVALGHAESGTWQGAFSAGLLVLLLAILEVSLSFDNAVVNASVLTRMTPLWRQRFITWGIPIAVFGMRLVFPLAIVSVLTSLSPWETFNLAAHHPDQYAKAMLSSRLPLSGFGGSFLLMVALKYFLNANKDIHWIRFLESLLSRLGKVESLEIVIVLCTLWWLSQSLPPTEQLTFLLSGIFGLIIFVFVDSLGSLLNLPTSTTISTARASVSLFFYLEMIDASFSFDGVIGAFALTHNLFLITIGLGIGAMFVRSLTILLVQEKTLTKFKYLEHGAFYAIGALAMMMLLEVIMHIPDFLTGLLGTIFIGLSFWSSLIHNRHSSKS